MRAILWSTILLLGIPAFAMAQAGGGAAGGGGTGAAGGAPSGTAAGGGALGGAGVAGGGFGGANSPAAGASGATVPSGVSGQNTTGPAATSPGSAGLGVGNGSVGSNAGSANNPFASPQTSLENQALGQRSGQTLQGPGAAASATQGTIGAPGISGGFFGVGQTAVTPNWGANSPPAAQPYQGTGINMPLTGPNARYDAAVGGVGAGSTAAQQTMNGTGPVTGNQQANPQGLNLERWRFQRHDDLWWYYSPQRTWAVFQGSQWVPYQRGALYTRDNLANAQIAGITDTQQRVRVGRPIYQGTGNYGATNYGP